MAVKDFKVVVTPDTAWLIKERDNFKDAYQRKLEEHAATLRSLDKALSQLGEAEATIDRLERELRAERGR